MSLQRLSLEQPQPLFGSAATRRLEQQAAAALPRHTLMQRAGRATARLAQALAPHARCYWVVCGGGNNGGDGLEAAWCLQRAGRPVQVSCLADPAALPQDARLSWERAQAVGVPWVDQPPTLGAQDLVIDALLGLGLTAQPGRALEARLRHWLHMLRSSPAALLSVDMPSGLIADSGAWAPALAPEADEAGAHQTRHTLSLLTLKPGLFTAQGRDAAGQLWLDDLGVCSSAEPPDAWLAGQPAPSLRAHASHKGSFGDVAVIGGQGLAATGLGMTGAALLAASAALHAGAGRVLLSLLDGGACQQLEVQPELMLRSFTALRLDGAVVVCGCGGGQAVLPVLPAVLAQARQLVLDADALNAIAADARLAQALLARSQQPGWVTVLTPHPLEAARLLGCSTQQVQADRLGAAQRLAQQLACVVLLKGAGTVVAAPGVPPWINPTGNARLATAGTGDVLAGLIGAQLAQAKSSAPTLTMRQALVAVLRACWQHGAAADAWPSGQALTASALAKNLKENGC